MRIAAAGVLFTLTACGQSEEVSTLYRSSVLDDSARLHVATFDAAQSRDYNAENCRLAQSLFQAQPGVKTKFWCELGPYRR